MKNVVVILGLALVQCLFMERAGRPGCRIDPQRARLLQPGITDLCGAIEILGAEPVYPEDSPRGVMTVVWYSAWGDLMDPDTLKVEYIVEARFDGNERLIDLTVVDHRSDPRDRGDANLMLQTDADWPASRRVRRSPERA